MDISPLEALLWTIRLTAGEVLWLTNKVNELEEEDVVGRPETERSKSGSNDNGPFHEDSKTVHPIELHVWVKARRQAIDSLASYSALALRAGVEERRVQMAERAGEGIARLLDGFISDLDLTKAQMRKAPALVRKHLAVLETTATEVDAA